MNDGIGAYEHARNTSQETNTTRPVAHGITIVQAGPPAATLRASCLCGWQSDVVPSRPRANAAGRAHTMRSAGAGLSPIECTPWCVVGDGHPDEVFREDQWCAGEDRRVSLSRTQPLGDELGPPYLSTYAMLRMDGEAHVAVSYSGATEMQLTVTEARLVATDLLIACNEIDGVIA